MQIRLPPPQSHKGANIICRALSKVFDKIRASVSCLASRSADSVGERSKRPKVDLPWSTRTCSTSRGQFLAGTDWKGRETTS